MLNHARKNPILDAKLVLSHNEILGFWGSESVAICIVRNCLDRFSWNGFGGGICTVDRFDFEGYFEILLSLNELESWPVSGMIIMIQGQRFNTGLGITRLDG